MEQILRKIANTIIANLGNTDSIGLFDGKMGLSLFLYRYARRSGDVVYEEIASSLLDEVLKRLNRGMTPSAIDGLASVGWGILSLLEDGFLENDPDDNILCDLDAALLANVRSTFSKEAAYPIPLLSSGLYLLPRISFQRNTVENAWIAGTIECVRMVIERSHANKYQPKLSLLNSILYVLGYFYKRLEFEKTGILSLQKEILSLSLQAIKAHSYQDIDVLIFREVVSCLPTTLCEKGEDVLSRIMSVPCFSKVSVWDVWYDNLWWNILYGLPIVRLSAVEKAELPGLVTVKIRDAFYDESTVNSQLAAVGLWLLKELHE